MPPEIQTKIFGSFECLQQDFESETPSSSPAEQATSELPQLPVYQASDGRPIFSCRAVHGDRSELIDAAFDDQEDLLLLGGLTHEYEPDDLSPACTQTKCAP